MSLQEIIIDTICSSVGTVLKIVSMIIWKSFVVYLLIQFIQTVMSNLIIQYWCNQHYSYIREKVEGKYDNLPQLMSNVKNIIANKVSGYVYSSTDNLIISTFIGVVQVGYMSGYYEVINILKSLASSITDPIQPIIGNFVHENNSKERSYELFRAYTLIRYIVANIIVVGLVVMIDPLMFLWLGEDYILPITIPILLAMDLFISIVHGPTGEFIIVLGLFKDDRNLSIIGMLINLIVSIVLVFGFGIEGVLMGTVFAQLYYWIARGKIVFTQYFKDGIFSYINRVIQFILVLIIDVIIANMIRKYLLCDITLLSFILMGVVCIVISVCSIFLFFGRTTEFKEVFDIIKKFCQSDQA